MSSSGSSPVTSVRGTSPTSTTPAEGLRLFALSRSHPGGEDLDRYPGVKSLARMAPCTAYCPVVGPNRPAGRSLWGGIMDSTLDEQQEPDGLPSVAATREAIRLDPGHAAYHDELGQALCSQERYAEAEAAFREAIRLDTDPSAGHTAAG